MQAAGLAWGGQVPCGGCFGQRARRQSGPRRPRPDAVVQQTRSSRRILLRDATGSGVSRAVRVPIKVMLARTGRAARFRNLRAVGGV